MQKGFFIQVTSPWRWPKDLSDRGTVILREAAAKGAVSSEMIAEMLKITDRAARKALALLVSKELLVKIGTTKGTAYKLK